VLPLSDDRGQCEALAAAAERTRHAAPGTLHPFVQQYPTRYLPIPGGGVI